MAKQLRPGDSVQIEPPGFFKYETGRVVRVRDHEASHGFRLIEVKLDNGSRHLYPQDLLYRRDSEDEDG